jgi:DNA-binding transcriptional regulator GbsR (MarR family)
MSKIAGELNAEMMHPKVIHEQRKALFAEMVGKTGSTQSVLDRLIQEIAELRQQLAESEQDRQDQIDLTIERAEEVKQLRQQLAEAQAAVKLLRDALMLCQNKIAFMLQHGEWYNPELALDTAREALANTGPKP